MYLAFWLSKLALRYCSVSLLKLAKGIYPGVFWAFANATATSVKTNEIRYFFMIVYFVVNSLLNSAQKNKLQPFLEL
jgi:hypothetical protein